jgi:predicted nucleotidyltransferase
MTRDAAIAEITRRLVEYFHPERIYLFGSVARGDDGPDSDLDFAVVVPDDCTKTVFRPGLYDALSGIGIAKDVVAWPATEFEGLSRHVKSSLPATIVREGKILYDARAVAA